ncbi:MAG: DUF4366 domain-containing protein [Clostridia bacterium]|nr:DUF4366 domain-containing protein [Clostridia bacterium]
MKPNKRKGRLLSGLLAVIVCMAAFSVSASAAGYYASDENGSNIPPGSIDSITISTEDVELENNGSNATTEIDGDSIDLDSFFNNLFNIFGGTDALTPVGNLTLIDDILQDKNTASVESVENEQKSKQFITVQSKNGNYFYIIIDRSGDTENVYFLNLVDEADLFALLETEEETTETELAPEPVCICEDKCITGEVNTKCEVCKLTMKECGGKKVAQTPDTPEPEPEEQDNSALLLLLLLLVAGGGAAYWYFKRYKPKQNIKGSTELDDSYFEDDAAEDDPVEYEENTEIEEENI